ncbi:hypothetical protein [Limosilactobacillus equigenerosi]|uniref:DUF3397 family protein n=2 Tax=Limosilactobacillus TaxID=2742598 RepID=A0A0R1US49_9LACO|nr:hypothetical protein [Limosilactobacillus equigenerosi]KRL96013.1 hypothetical protein FC21_GL000711 [Limosilactobacillus equigenerosi DSM 18793 = JCM 14505]
MSGDKFTDYRLKFQISFFKMVAIREEKRGKFMAGMNVQNIILDGLIIVGCYVFEWLITKLTETPLAMLQKKLRWLWVLVLMALALKNLGLYWSALPILGWSIIGLTIVIVQWQRYHELVYRRFWHRFWKLSYAYAILIFIGSIFSYLLPIV